MSTPGLGESQSVSADVSSTEARRRFPLPLVLTLLAGALLACTRLGSLDLPLMLANGDRILTDGEIPRTNVFSWVNSGHRYVNDKWGFMVLVHALDVQLGTAGLAALKLVLGAATGGVLYALVRRHASGLAAAGIAVLGLVMLSYRFHLRAEWISVLALGAVLLLLPGVLEGRRRPTLLFLLLIPVWAAFHGYWYLGPVVVAVAALTARRWMPFAAGLGGFLAGAVSPYGVLNLLHPMKVLRQLSGSVLGDAITELRTPFVAELTGAAPFTLFHGLALVLAALALIALVLLARARRWSEAAVLLVLVLVSLRIDRNLALLGLTVPLVAAAPLPEILRRGMAWGGLLAPIVVHGVIVGAPPIAVDRLFGLGDHPGRFPVEVVRESKERWPRDKFVNDLSIGSYLVSVRGQAFIDGNTEGYPESFLAMYRQMLSGETTVWDADRLFRNDGYILRHGAATTRVLVLGLFLSRRYSPEVWDDVATVFRREVDPEQEDARWREWLRDVYLPLARTWYPTPEEALAVVRAEIGEIGAPGAANEYAFWRRALELCPYEPRFYDRFSKAARAGGHADAAHRAVRFAMRLRDL